ncbi:MAG: DNA polymerase III subunit gamma/tau [Nevskiales bacterium]
MSYQVLARKWRPRKFEELVGQGHVVRALQHALDQDRLHPALLLSGTRGVGKTTIARIIAKGLNCETGVSAKPCGICSACVEIDEGRFVDLMEIDAASQTKVDETRDLLEQTQYLPARGRYKVYLIDEVHMLSRHSFNALLKTLEEPPAHTKFLLATTDPQKLPITVLSRCLQFHLKRLPATEIRARLEHILKEEKITAEPASLLAVARAADGSLRDALSLLDQAIAYGGGQLKAEDVKRMLGSIARHDVLGLLAAVAQGRAAEALTALSKLDEQAPDYASVLDELAATLQRVARLQLVPGWQDDDNEDSGELLDLSQQLTAEDVQVYYQIVLNGRRDLAWAPEPRTGLEMTVLRMLAFGPAMVEAGQAPAPQRSPTAAPKSPPAAMASGAAAADWTQIVAALKINGFEAELLRNCVCVERAPGRLKLQLSAKYQHLLDERRRARAEQALSEHLGQPVKLKIEVAQNTLDTTGTPAQQAVQQQLDRQQAAERALQEDPVVKDLQSRLGATIHPGSVEPL